MLDAGKIFLKMIDSYLPIMKIVEASAPKNTLFQTANELGTGKVRVPKKFNGNLYGGKCTS
jgi:hypothetical protein